MTHKRSALAVFSLVFGLASAAPFNALAQKTSDGSENKERRAEMAKMHEEMAKCLKSDKPTSECRKQMKKGCPMCKDMGSECCPDDAKPKK